jgi:hypothetical protein
MPTALIRISDNHVTFRLQTISPRQFHVYLERLKKQLPTMTWNPVERVWQLPVDQLQSVYEACRTLFGPTQVRLTMKYKPFDKSFQLTLLD